MAPTPESFIPMDAGPETWAYGMAQDCVEVQILEIAAAAMRTLRSNTITDQAHNISRSLSKDETYAVLRCMMQSVSSGQHE